MSESSEGRWGTAFFLGFLLGMFVCLGAGGTFGVFKYRQMQMRLEQLEAEVDLREAEARRALAESEALLTERLLRPGTREAPLVLTGEGLERFLKGMEGPAGEAEQILVAPKEKVREPE